MAGTKTVEVKSKTKKPITTVDETVAEIDTNSSIALDASPQENKVKTVYSSDQENTNQKMVAYEVSITTEAKKEQASDNVNVLIKYPENWDKAKFFQDGDIKEVSIETAKLFVSIGIASYIN
jgi:hypothetical protein